jgi:hypothetical protein
MTVLPNIYDAAQLREFAGACDAPALEGSDLERIAALARENFGVEEPPGRYKGTMSEPAAAVLAAGSP